MVKTWSLMMRGAGWSVAVVGLAVALHMSGTIDRLCDSDKIATTLRTLFTQHPSAIHTPIDTPSQQTSSVPTAMDGGCEVVDLLQPGLVTFHEAQHLCHTAGLHLPSPRSAADMQSLLALGVDMWLGLARSPGDGQFRDADGTVASDDLSGMFGGVGERNLRPGAECMGLSIRSQRVNDIPCDQLNRVLCMKCPSSTSSLPTPSPSYLPGVSVWWFAPFWAGGGYSSEAVSFALGLQPRLPDGLRITHFADEVRESFIHSMPQGTFSLLRQLQSTPVAHHNTIVVCHSEPGAWYPPLYNTHPCPPQNPTPRYTIGRTMFETDRIPDKWENRCNGLDEIWVPTEFAARIFRQHGVDPNKVVVMPEGVDTDDLDPAAPHLAPWTHLPPSASPLTRPCLEGDVWLVSVFKLEPRKGWDVLLGAYFSEFDSKEPVCLILRTWGYHNDRPVEHVLAQFTSEYVLQSERPFHSLPRVVVLPDFISEDDMKRLYNAASAFVLPTRGEGWGRPIVEAMSMGTPAIATMWSGPTAYLNATNGYPLPIDGLTLVGSGPFKDHKWAEPSATTLQEMMRMVVSRPAEAQEKGRMARKTMVEEFSTHVVTDLVVARLAEIAVQLEL